MAENLYVVHSNDHQGHRPKTFFNFGEMQDNLEKPERIEAIRAALESLPRVRVDECQRWIVEQGKAAGWKPKELWIACNMMTVGWLMRCIKQAPDGTQKLIAEISKREQEVYGQQNLGEI